MNKKRNQPSAVADLYESPTFRLMRDINNSPSLRAVRDLQRSGVFDELTRVSQSQAALVEALNSSRWLQMHDEMTALSRVVSQSSALASATSINTDLARCVTHISAPAFPEIDRFAEMARSIAESFQPFRSDVLGWSTRIQTQIELLQNPWALAGIEALSVTGFAKISYLSNCAQNESPFGAEPAAFFRDQLFTPDEELEGDQAEKDDVAIESGLNPELIAFYPSEYSHVLSTAGFSVSFSQVAVPVSEGRENTGEAYNPAHDALLKQVEILLRQLIEQSLHSISGDRWIKQRVPGAMKQKWEHIRQQEHQTTGKRFGLIHYADFMDLADLICQKNNWNDAFSDLFVSQEDFRISMARLHPIRKSLAHARPLARSEVLLLVAEASRILTVLRVIFP